MHTTTAKNFAKRLSEKLRKGVIKGKLQKQYYFNHVVIPYAEDGLWKFDTTDTKVLFVPVEVFDTPEHVNDLKVMKGELPGNVDFDALEDKAGFIWDMKVSLHDFIDLIGQAYQDKKETEQLKYVPIVLDLTYLEPSEKELEAYHNQVKKAREGDAKAKKKQEKQNMLSDAEVLADVPTKTVVIETEVLKNLVLTIAQLSETNKELTAIMSRLSK